MDVGLIFEQVDIKVVNPKNNHLAYNDDTAYFVVAISNKSKTVKINDEYVGLDNDSVYITKDSIVLEHFEDAIVISVKGELCSKYISQDMINSVLSFSAHTKILRVVNSLLNDKMYIADMDQKKRFCLAMDVLSDIIFYESENIDKTNRVVNDALYYIHEYYYEIYGIEQLADRLNVSKSYLIRMFKKQMDTTPLLYIQQFKIEKAKEFLLQQSLDIKTVAGLCGYSSSNYFGKVFKRICGVAPHEYREQNISDMQDSLPDEFYL